jgi:hypothetical protein
LELVLHHMGFAGKPGSGVAAFQQALASA